MTGSALTISDNKDVITKMAAVFEFIDYKVALAHGIESAKAEIDKDKNFLIALISLSDEDELN